MDNTIRAFLWVQRHPSIFYVQPIARSSSQPVLTLLGRSVLVRRAARSDRRRSPPRDLRRVPHVLGGGLRQARSPGDGPGCGDPEVQGGRVASRSGTPRANEDVGGGREGWIGQVVLPELREEGTPVMFDRRTWALH